MSVQIILLVLMCVGSNLLTLTIPFSNICFSCSDQTLRFGDIKLFSNFSGLLVSLLCTVLRGFVVFLLRYCCSSRSIFSMVALDFSSISRFQPCKMQMGHVMRQHVCGGLRTGTVQLEFFFSISLPSLWVIKLSGRIKKFYPSVISWY